MKAGWAVLEHRDPGPDRERTAAMDSVPASPQAGNGGIWRMLILDANPDDPMWIICSVSLDSDVRPAAMEGRR